MSKRKPTDKYVKGIIFLCAGIFCAGLVLVLLDSALRKETLQMLAAGAIASFVAGIVFLVIAFIESRTAKKENNRKESGFSNKKMRDVSCEWKVQYDLKTIVKRALALSYVCLLTETLGSNNKNDEEFIMNLINDSGLKEFFTKKEMEFVYGERTEQDILDFNWHYERLAVLLWALGQKISLNKWDELIDVSSLIQIINDRNFVNNAKLTELQKIAQYEQEANEAYWICVDAKIHNRLISEYSTKNINPEIARERLTAIRWIYSLEKTEWDDCMPDTYCPYI